MQNLRNDYPNPILLSDSSHPHFAWPGSSVGYVQAHDCNVISFLASDYFKRQAPFV